MAKNVGKLAGLAALAGAAYMMSKDKGKADSGSTTPARPESTENRVKTQAQSIAEADKSVGSSPSPNLQQPSGVLTQGTDKSAVDLSANRNQPAKPAPAPVVNPVVATTTSTPPAQVNRNMEDATKQKVLDTLNQRAGANTPSALRSDQLANVSRATKREQKTKQFAQDVPYQESAAKTDAMMVASRAARKADALKKTAKKSSFKSGGMVSKVSSASSRADGIASRGKTRCKMY
jgi:hypothetical protein